MAARNKVIYIIGPFRGPTTYAIELNVREAEDTALEVWKRGGIALCPHLNTRFFQGELPDLEWLAGDLVLLQRCDAAFTALGWENSAGSRAEVNACKGWGIPVFHQWPALQHWLDTDVICERLNRES